MLTKTENDLREHNAHVNVYLRYKHIIPKIREALEPLRDRPVERYRVPPAEITKAVRQKIAGLRSELDFGSPVGNLIVPDLERRFLPAVPLDKRNPYAALDRVYEWAHTVKKPDSR